MTKPWKFSQMGETDNITVTLSGYAAPFGRPRQSPVVSTSKELRMQEVRYPGSDNVTRNIFGTKQNDFELTGRWMDWALGTGVAKSLVLQFEQMLQDAKRLNISWGDDLIYEGFLKKVDAKWESLTEVAWTLTFAIDHNEQEIGPNPPSPKDQAQKTFIDDVNAWLNEGLPNLKSPSSFIGDVMGALDAVNDFITEDIDDVIAAATYPAAVAVQLANKIDNLETATYDELQRLRTGLSMYKTAVLTLQRTVDSVQIDTMLLDRQAEDDIAWLSFKSNSDVQTTKVLGSTTRMMLTVDRVLHGTVARRYTARLGDTWESISTTMYGGPSGADKIRQANGIKYGDQPVPGKTYQIPKL